MEQNISQAMPNSQGHNPHQAGRLGERLPKVSVPNGTENFGNQNTAQLRLRFAGRV
jgi:hypothetical protein